MLRSIFDKENAINAVFPWGGGILKLLNYEVSYNLIKLNFQGPWKICSLKSLKFTQVFTLAAMHSS